ncbi:hydrolase or acyltransferase of alpha/beta superfamily protein [Halogeometricum borinquense DSM 11551]|uniref:Hydrolase or acyltransferase of alpha/beta superfamily protein n=1 Tax=Halogeometricum borinquense (strain ATCC 700274 / DSM 11551 / JCM 10706 / KCTC 4070 / PR3) TaxID=469382 RepID=E4NRA3_HALBP|nr:alpha/beta hydrolase [Halogeometricum borinquense]ADQ67944.1 predicted hydrolase or acyltransferase of alpha/beta superfamily [Halogeometricum borinquense DSM 11551]ELY24136.1 hydrolase or acyltransferase of alpha/beta superfamily protein [Halogeometricum borinquense DSM 11551]
MKLRNVVGGVVAGTGLLAAANAVLSRRTPPLEPALSGEQHTYRWRGMDVHYTEAGDEDDPNLLLLHGVNAAASNGEFREVFDELAEDYHVIAPDLPGFGMSDRPPLRYSAALYEDFIGEFVAEFDDPAVVASSLTASYLIAADPDVSRLILVCPSERGGPEPKEWLRELIRAPVIGEAVFNLIGSKPSIRYFNADHGYADPSRVSDEWIDYEWRTAHQQNARFAPASFISGYLNEDIDLETELADVDVPVTLVWGRDSDLVPLKRGRELAEAADCKLVVFDDTKLLPHVEFPEQFLSTVREDVGIPA